MMQGYIMALIVLASRPSGGLISGSGGDKLDQVLSWDTVIATNGTTKRVVHIVWKPQAVRQFGRKACLRRMKAFIRRPIRLVGIDDSNDFLLEVEQGVSFPKPIGQIRYIDISDTLAHPRDVVLVKISASHQSNTVRN